MNKNMIQNLLKLFRLCMEISETTEHDVFFDYSPHVDGFSVSVHEGGWREGNDSIYSANVYDITNKKINSCRQKLLKYRRTEHGDNKRDKA